MKTSRTIIAGILFLAIAFSCFACSGSGQPDETTAAPDDTAETTAAQQVDVYTRDAEPLSDELCSLDYGGSTFTILSRVGYEYGKDQFTVEELNSDPVNDAVYNRNIAVEDMLNIEIREVGKGYEDIITEVQKVVMSGDSDYDAVAGSVAYNTPQIDQGYFYNLYSNGIETYLDLDKPWWPQDWIEEARMGDRLYCLTGPLCMTFRRFVYVFYYNKDLGTDLGLENMYDVVDEGRWTIDYLSAVTKDLYLDLNGNSERDNEDQYGLLMNDYDHVDIFWSCFDMDFLAKDEDGWFIMNANPDKISVAYDKVYSLVHDNIGTNIAYSAGGSTKRIKAFANGQALFCCEHLELAESESLRNAGIDYGMLPQPKFDEAQKEYYAYSHDQYSVLMVPVSVRDPEMVGAVLQALDHETYTKVEPALFDQTLKGKYSNDPETRKIINLILDGMVEDASWIYGYNIAHPQIACFRGPIDMEQHVFASEFAKVQRVTPVALEEWRKKIEAIGH